MTVIYIRAARTRGYLRIGVSDGEKEHSFTVSESEYKAAGSPLSRDNLTRESYNTLFIADMRYNARLRATRILSYGDNSEKRLTEKLVFSGISRDVATEVTHEMVSLGYINSERQLERLVTSEVNIKLNGPRKIIPRLVAKGYSRSDIQNMIDELLRQGIIDFDAAREKLIKSKLGDDADSEEIKKLLYKNGYSVC